MADLDPESFVQMNVSLAADPNLEDWEYRCLAALESWAWEKDDCWPGNSEIATRCGWVKGGKWSRSKVKRALVGLEGKGYIHRIDVFVNGARRRDRIVLCRKTPGGPYAIRGGPQANPPGLPVNHPGPSADHPWVIYGPRIRLSHRSSHTLTESYEQE